MSDQKTAPAESQEPTKSVLGKKPEAPEDIAKFFDESLDSSLTSVVDANGQAQVISIPEDKLPPVYINGEPHFIIRGKYIPYDDGRVIFQERLVNQEIKKLEYMKRLADHNRRLKAVSDEAIAAKKAELDQKRADEEKRQRQKHEDELKKSNL